METLLQDVRYGWRMLRKSLTFTTVAVITLALGIGANTAIFSIVDAVLLQPLPYGEPNRIFAVWQKIPQEDHVPFSTPEFQDWEKQTQVFDGLAASTGNGFTLTGYGDPAMLLGQMVTPNLFPVLGVSPVLGRTFSTDEARAGHDHVVLLSQSLWKEQFGSDPQILSRAITLNGESYSVVGVMGPDFSYPAARYRLWVPAALDAGIFQKFHDAHFLHVVGRLKPGINNTRLETELSAVSHHLAQADPTTERRLQYARLQELQTGEIRRPLLLIMGAVGLVLLIACSNVANLLLVRTAGRKKEMAVRVAVGAGRLRIVRQLLVESLLLSFLGGLLGLLLSLWGLRSLVTLLPEDLPGVRSVHLDARVLAFTALISVATGILFGLAPALANWTRGWSEVLSQGDRASGGASLAPRLRSALILAEVGISVVLLSSAFLMIRSLVRLQRVDPGFRPNSVLTASLAMSESRYPEAANMRAFYRALLEKLRTLPGVESAALNTAVPFSGQGWGNNVDIEGHPAASGHSHVVQVECISPAYFSAMGIVLQSGRDFGDTDSEKSNPVAIIDSAMARNFWPGENPIGKRVNLDGPWRTVVGVVVSVKKTGLDASEEPQLYVPYLQLSPAVAKFLGRGLFVVIHSSLDTVSLTQSVRHSLFSVDPEMTLTDVSTMDDLLRASVAEPRLRTLLLGIFAAVALALACLGIYGVMSYMVSQREHEIGIRAALGADHGSILRLVMGKALLLTLAGIAAGLLGTLLVGRLLVTLLFGVSPYDPLTLTSVPILLTGVAMLASYLPARRAARVDPMVALRYE